MSSQLRDMEDYQKKFVANVSHDFRSPLTSIKGYVEAMTDGTIPPELHEKYLKIILFVKRNVDIFPGTHRVYGIGRKAVAAVWKRDG